MTQFQAVVPPAEIKARRELGDTGQTGFHSASPASYRLARVRTEASQA